VIPDLFTYAFYGERWKQRLVVGVTLSAFVLSILLAFPIIPPELVWVTSIVGLVLGSILIGYYARIVSGSDTVPSFSDPRELAFDGFKIIIIALSWVFGPLIALLPLNFLFGEQALTVASSLYVFVYLYVIPGVILVFSRTGTLSDPFDITLLRVVFTSDEYITTILKMAVGVILTVLATAVFTFITFGYGQLLITVTLPLIFHWYCVSYSRLLAIGMKEY